MSDLLEEVRRFVEDEARLLDQRRFEDWLALYSDDAIYWIPREQGQTDPLAVPSIIHENKPILAMRVSRMADAAMHSAQPASRTLHIVGSIAITGLDSASGAHRVISAQLVIESRAGETRFHSGQCEHLLRRRSGGGFTIVQKRIDLIDCDAVRSPMPILL